MNSLPTLPQIRSRWLSWAGGVLTGQEWSTNGQVLLSARGRSSENLMGLEAAKTPRGQ